MGKLGHSLADAILAWGLKSAIKQAGLHRFDAALSFGRVSYLSNRANASTTDTEAIVLLHGIVANAHCWPSWVKALKPTTSTIIAPDLPGHGASVSDLALDYSIAAQAARLKELLLTLGIRRAHLVGNSMGGAIALHLAASEPDLVASLLLIGSAGSHVSPSALQNIIAQTGRNPMLDVATITQYRAMLQIGMQHPPKLPDFIARAALRDYQRRQTLNLAVANDVLTDLDQTALLAQISAPTLILWGKLDQVIHPDNAHFLQQHIANSQLHIIAGAGHMTMLDAPERVAALCTDFYATLATRG